MLGEGVADDDIGWSVFRDVKVVGRVLDNGRGVVEMLRDTVGEVTADDDKLFPRAEELV